MTKSTPRRQSCDAELETRKLSPEAQRALAEAEARRSANECHAKKTAKEIGGRNGLDPARFGDWEKDGIASDF